MKWLDTRELRPATDIDPARTLSAGSVRNIYEVLARVMDAAAEDRVIAISPCQRIALPKDHDDEVGVPTLEEIELVRCAIGERWRAVPVVLVVTTGSSSCVPHSGHAPRGVAVAR